MKKVLEHLQAAKTELLNEKSKSALDLGGTEDTRSARARLIAIAITDLEKVISFVSYYLEHWK